MPPAHIGRSGRTNNNKRSIPSPLRAQQRRRSTGARGRRPKQSPDDFVSRARCVLRRAALWAVLWALWLTLKALSTSPRPGRAPATQPLVEPCAPFLSLHPLFFGGFCLVGFWCGFFWWGLRWPFFSYHQEVTLQTSDDEPRSVARVNTHVHRAPWPQTQQPPGSQPPSPRSTSQHQSAANTTAKHHKHTNTQHTNKHTNKHTNNQASKLIGANAALISSVVGPTWSVKLRSATPRSLDSHRVRFGRFLIIAAAGKPLSMRSTHTQTHTPRIAPDPRDASQHTARAAVRVALAAGMR